MTEIKRNIANRSKYDRYIPHIQVDRGINYCYPRIAGSVPPNLEGQRFSDSNGAIRAAVLEDFRDKGLQASYHYAADYGDEWRYGQPYEKEAREIARQFPEFSEEFNEVSKDFLWNFNANGGTNNENI